jgi:hypothetical protein
LPLTPNAKPYIKSLTYVSLGVVVTVLGVLAVGAFGDYFSTYPFYSAVAIFHNLSVDVFGALTPIIIALVSLGLFLKTTKAPKKLAGSLLATITLAFLLCHPTDNGVAGYPLLFSLIAAVAATVVGVFPKPLADLKKSLTSNLMLTLTCTPLALLSVDAYYSAYYPGSIIGGNGLSDGILISTLYAPVSTIAVFSILTYITQTVWLVSKNRTQTAPELKPILSNEPN